MTNRGFQHDPTADPQAYIFGATSPIIAQPIQADRDWTPWVPTKESQLQNGFDPLSCASYGSLNVIETYLHRVFGVQRNYSDRWLAYKTGTKNKKGNDPHLVLEWLRTNGDVTEDNWPFTIAVNSYDEYYVVPNFELDALAKLLADEWVIKHDTVRGGANAMWDALQYSPLGVSVGFNAVDQNGYWYKNDNGPDSHWCAIVGGKYGEYFLIFDSAEPSLKKAAWDKLNPQLVKRIAITKREPSVEKLSLIAKLLKAVLDLLIRCGKACVAIVKPATMPVEAPKLPQEPSNPSTPSEPSAADKLYKAAKSAIGRDASPANLAPSDRACAEAASSILRQVIKDFPIFVSTTKLNAYLAQDRRFKRTESYQAGTIAIAPTQGQKTGHCWIMGNTHAMSNTSKTGKWEANYTNAGVAKDAAKRGLPLFYYLPL
jgi:hypothetical protein